MRTNMVCCKGTTKHCFINQEGRPLSLKQACPEIHDILRKGKNAPFPPSLSNVRISRSASSSTTVRRSTTSPFSLAAVAALASPSLNYLRMAHFGETMIIDVSVEEYNGIKLTLAYEVANIEPSFNVIFMFLPSPYFFFTSYLLPMLYAIYHGSRGTPALCSHIG